MCGSNSTVLLTALTGGPALCDLVLVVFVERLDGGQHRVVSLDRGTLLTAERAVPDGHLQAGTVLVEQSGSHGQLRGHGRSESRGVQVQ